MTPERWRQVEELYHAVQEDRAALEKADPELRREVESLLAQPRGDAPLDRPVVDLPDDATVTQMAVDSTLGPYRIEGLLGAGGMGEVYRAVDTRLGRKVAIKMAGKQFTQRFEREARTIAALNHPNICTLYDIGPHYLVMELLEGETLRGRLKRSPPDWRGAAEIAAAVAEGLAAAHFRRIVHHDLKPENIFLTQPADGTAGRTVILDFGLARWTASDVRAGETASVITQAGMIMGTVGYMSPEQVRGDATGPASDLFSLCCVLYEMLAGRPPFKRFTATETLLAILRDAFEPLPSALPVDLIHQVARCLEKTPELRCRSAGELASSLRAILSGQWPSGGTVTQGQESLIDSLAIVPFKNTSGNADTDFLSDGITESLINSFSRLPGLRVVARSRVLRYKGKDFEAAALGRELGVRALLTGRVLQRGETLRVQAELVEAASETQIWGERFQGNLADILTFEEQIVLQIAAKLRPRMGWERSLRGRPAIPTLTGSTCKVCTPGTREPEPA